jgi:dihydroneopterin aldolase
MSRIALENMLFYAHHGCFEEEQAIGTRFRLDVTYETDTTRAQQTDDISDTVSYLDVYQTVKREVMKPSHLLEHVGERICESVLSEYPAIDSVSVKVSKLAPPLGGELEAVSVEITKDRCRQS